MYVNPVNHVRNLYWVNYKVVKFLDEFCTDKGTLVKWHLCEPLTFDLKPGDGLAEVKYVLKSDVTKICDPIAVSRWPQKVRKCFES